MGLSFYSGVLHRAMIYTESVGCQLNIHFLILMCSVENKYRVVFF